MSKIKWGILAVLMVMALVSVASAALPPVVTGTIHHPGVASYFDVDLLTGGNAELPTPSMYTGFCADALTHVTTPSTHTYAVYSSLDAGNLVPSINSAEWNKINWILNNKGLVTKWQVIQAAIWHYDGLSTEPYPHHTSLPLNSYSHAEYDSLIAAANNHEDFIPDCGGQTYAVLLIDRVGGSQPIFVEGKTPTCGQNIPEFPTLALPAGMIIGIVGLVYFMKSREN